MGLKVSRGYCWCEESERWHTQKKIKIKEKETHLPIDTNWTPVLCSILYSAAGYTLCGLRWQVASSKSSLLALFLTSPTYKPIIVSNNLYQSNKIELLSAVYCPNDASWMVEMGPSRALEPRHHRHRCHAQLFYFARYVLLRLITFYNFVAIVCGAWVCDVSGFWAQSLLFLLFPFRASRVSAVDASNM